MHHALWMQFTCHFVTVFPKPKHFWSVWIHPVSPGLLQLIHFVRSQENIRHRAFGAYDFHISKKSYVGNIPPAGRICWIGSWWDSGRPQVHGMTLIRFFLRLKATLSTLWLQPCLSPTHHKQATNLWKELLGHFWKHVSKCAVLQLQRTAQPIRSHVSFRWHARRVGFALARRNQSTTVLHSYSTKHHLCWQLCFLMHHIQGRHL